MSGGEQAMLSLPNLSPQFIARAPSVSHFRSDETMAIALSQRYFEGEPLESSQPDRLLACALKEWENTRRRAVIIHLRSSCLRLGSRSRREEKEDRASCYIRKRRRNSQR